MMLKSRTFVASLLGLALSVLASAALADDWVAVKLRGSVFTYLEGSWVLLHRGDVVPDERVVRTQPSGHVVFQRDGESIDVGPNTQIQIVDRTGKRYTTVRQYYGKVEIEAEIENVQHFAVRTPYLAAVVKGTNFIVTSDGDSSKVAVRRGHVAVEDLASHEQVLVSAGQTVETVPQDALAVTGRPDVVSFRNGAAAFQTSPAEHGSSGNTDADGGAGGSPMPCNSGGASGGLDAGGLDVSVSAGGGPAASVGVGASAGGVDVSVSTGGGGQPAQVNVQTPLRDLGIGLGL